MIELRPGDIRLDDVREAIRLSELTEYGDIINAVVSVPLFRRVHELGIKVVLTGDGSDELFGGYPMYERAGPAAARRLFLHKIRNLCRTELQRVDRASMACGLEVRAPFLDPRPIKFTKELSDAGRSAYKASQSRNQDAVIASTDQLAESCLNCHVVYRDKPGGPASDPSNKAARCIP